jgi:hypothetical protein
MNTNTALNQAFMATTPSPNPFTPCDRYNRAKTFNFVKELSSPHFASNQSFNMLSSSNSTPNDKLNLNDHGVDPESYANSPIELLDKSLLFSFRGNSVKKNLKETKEVRLKAKPHLKKLDRAVD